jgi:hypothetical protein
MSSLLTGGTLESAAATLVPQSEQEWQQGLCRLPSFPAGCPAFSDNKALR